MSDNAYIGALRTSLSRYQAELSEIRAILAQRTLSNLEYRAAERILQVSIETSIGVAKHWAKTLAGHTPQDANQAFEFLVLRGELCPDTLICWSKLIGLRNTLVQREFNFEVRHSPMPPDGTLRIP
ncbi:DUF86 domain-containing protein [Aeromonas veronii]|uniref:DUF86 domain-containing protein n=1 Tax=Aeromonas veronii TaxID=654 RepID=UPI003D1DFEC7